MALTKKYNKVLTYCNIEEATDTIEVNKTFDEAYIKITNVEGNKNKIMLQVCIYKDCNKEEIVSIKKYAFTPSVAEGSTNFIQQGYEYLKTLPEYAEAVDC